MSKWKCGICNSEFENYHAQGFDNIIYCPLCYYKKLYKRDKKEIERLNNIINELEKYIHNELVLDFYNDDMPCELIINKMEKMIKALKENNK